MTTYKLLEKHLEPADWNRLSEHNRSKLNLKSDLAKEAKKKNTIEDSNDEE